MVTRADLGGARPLSSVEAPAPVASATDARREVLQRLARIAIGTELQAKVLSVLEDGNFLVQIGDARARMALPAGIRVGDTLSMTLLAQQPRPTFLLGSDSATTSLSAAGRLVDALLHSAPEGKSAAVISQLPLLPEAQAPDARQLAAKLQDALSRSGLFYESHLQEWIAGSRPQADLLREPQAHFGKAIAQDAEEGQVMRRPDGARPLAEPVRMIGAEAAGKADMHTYALVQAHAAPGLEPEQARMIGLQLNALEHRQVRWQGELWPGQPFEWEVDEDAHGDNTDGEARSTWTSSLRFELPALGPVSATIRLTGDRVLVQVGAASASAAAAMRSHGDHLAVALEASGSRLDALTVRQDGAE